MLNRLVVMFLVIGGLGLLWLGWHYYKIRLLQTIRATDTSLNKPTLLYFTADYCAICKGQQAPIVETIAATLGDLVAVKKLDVTERPELASHYKVMTLPTTVILDAVGEALHINYGFTQQTKLETQLLRATAD